MLLKFLGLIAVVSVAMCLVPAGVHFFELANKMSMSSPEYRAEDLCGVVLFWHRGYRRASNHLDTHFHGTQRSYGLFSLACCVPLPSRHLGDLLDVHIPNERSEQQLDGHTGRLRGGAAAVGVCVRGDHPFCASHQSRSAVMQANWTQWSLEEDHAHLADSKRRYASGSSWRALEPFLCLPNDRRCRLRPAATTEPSGGWPRMKSRVAFLSL